MASSDKKITCPSCGVEIDVNDILYHQVEATLKKKFNEQLGNEKARYEQDRKALEDAKAQLQADQEAQARTVAAAIKDGLKAEAKRLKTELEAEQSDRLRDMTAELDAKSRQLKELNRTKSELERVKREKDEIRSTLEAENEQKLNQIIADVQQKTRKAEEEKSTLRLAEQRKVIEDLQKQLQDAQRKAAQGSMQLQGEVQELAIEEWLAETFPLDTIEEIKKGARGADCLQTVNTRRRTGCGTIYYESKRTKGFQAGWIEKFKGDIQERNANIGVLVTEAMPDGMERLGQMDGVWICSFEEFKGLSLVLRESLIQVSAALATQENKGTKMEMLYKFFTGDEFRRQIEAIVESFTQMRTDLESEKRAMLGLWKKREKQIAKVQLNVVNMYGSLKGISGNAVGSLPLLELTTDDEE